MSDQDRASQVERNFEAFQRLLPELLATHLGKTALLHDGEVVDFFDSFSDAVKVGEARFGSPSAFSAQEVKPFIQSLGYFSHAVGLVP